MIHILIDDIRDLPGMDIIVRNGELGCDVVKQFDIYNIHLYIDHDLGSGMNGYQVIGYLNEFHKLPNNIQIVSSNPVGVKNIREALISYGYTAALDGRNFKR